MDGTVLTRLSSPRTVGTLRSRVVTQDVKTRPPPAPPAALDIVQEFVAALDRNNDDHVEESELLEFVRSLPGVLSSEIASEMFRQADVSGKGKISAKNIVRATSGRYRLTDSGSVWENAPHREHWIRLLQHFRASRGESGPVEERAKSPPPSPKPICAAFEQPPPPPSSSSPALRSHSLPRSRTADGALHRSALPSSPDGRRLPLDPTVVRAQHAERLLARALRAPGPRALLSTTGTPSVPQLTQSVIRRTAPGGHADGQGELLTARARIVHEFLQRTEPELLAAQSPAASPSAAAGTRAVPLEPPPVDDGVAVFSFEAQAQFNAILRSTVQQSRRRHELARLDTTSSKAQFAARERARTDRTLRRGRSLEPRVRSRSPDDSAERPATPPPPSPSPRARSKSPRSPREAGFVTAFHLDDQQTMRIRVARDQADMRGPFTDPMNYDFRPPFDYRTSGRKPWVRRVGRMPLPREEPLDVRPRETIMREKMEKEKEAERELLRGKPRLTTCFHLPSNEYQLGAPDRRQPMLDPEPFPPPTSYIAMLDRKVKQVLGLHEPTFQVHTRTLRRSDRENLGLQISKRGEPLL